MQNRDSLHIAKLLNLSHYSRIKMFPQSELENYKLQVELLQEKLQRSEISRQHLEQKLDMILQKRNEQDKSVRSKAKQKYKQFLEEQKRRNERKKQLVQMLERIEQQTEAMNAKSEKLKMTKLQYEMYFTTLVHSQTRLCIQNSVNPATHIITTPPKQTKQSTPAALTSEGHNCKTNIAIPMLVTNQTLESTSYLEKNSFSTLQPPNTSLNNTVTPTPINVVKTPKNNYSDFLTAAPSIHADQSNAYPQTVSSNNIEISEDRTYYKQEIPNINIYSKANDNTQISSVTRLLPNDEEFSSSMAAGGSINFETTQNLATLPQKIHNTISETFTDTADIDDTEKDKNFLQSYETKDNNKTSREYLNENDKSATENLHNVYPDTTNNNLISQKTKNSIENSKNKLKPINVTMSKLHELEDLKDINENSFNNTNVDNNKSKLIAKIESETSAKNLVSNSSPGPISIENIENKIYGELLSPLENMTAQDPGNPNVVPKLLENLFNEHENEDKRSILFEESIVEADGTTNGNVFENINEPFNKIEQNSGSLNYEQATHYNDYNNTPHSEELASNFADYINYENVDSNSMHEGQEQQQYDYSNYDPTQYSYPGYIYDENSGEYKADSNTSVEKYTKNQEYSSEGYDNQEYEQQNYDDYNQHYSETPNTTSINEDTLYNSCETLPISDINKEQQHVEMAEPIPQYSDLRPEETTASAKVIKPTSILSTADKNEMQKKKKRVNFIDNSEKDNNAQGDRKALSVIKTTPDSTTKSNTNFLSSTEPEVKNT